VAAQLVVISMSSHEAVYEPPHLTEDPSALPPAIADRLRRLTEIQEDLADLARTAGAPTASTRPDPPAPNASR
jgi:hypothetical protein